MTPTDVLFIGSSWHRMASVRVRCVDIAKYLHWQYCLDVASADDIPRHFKMFVLVKPRMDEAQLTALAKRGIIVWDIIDRAPPPGLPICIYLASTSHVAHMHQELGRVELIPHYHCHFETSPFEQDPSCRRPVWIGQYTWYPLLDFDHDAYDTRSMSRQEVSEVHRRMGIGLNLRAFRPETYWHTIYNSGVKLLNCVGAGIPSVSLREPAYLEWGEGCTVFVTNNHCGAEVERLQSDDRLYRQLRSNCRERGWRFHVSEIAKLYQNLVAHA